MKHGIPRVSVKSKPKLNRSKLVNFELHLPSCMEWKVLHCLHDDVCQYLTDEENALISRVIRMRDISAYYALSEDWGLRSMDSGGTGLAAKRAKYQLASFLKKFVFKTDAESRRQQAQNSFREAEDACRAFNLDGWRRLAISMDQMVVEVYTYAQSFVRKVIGNHPNEKDLTRSRHGPGVSRGTEKGQTSQYAKFAHWPYSVTPHAFGYGVAAIENDQRWRGALEEDYRRVMEIAPWVPLDMALFWRNVFVLYPGNRITTVPKNGLTDRSIAIEPTMNLYLQLGVDGFIRKRLKRWGIDLDDQTIH